MIIQSYPKVIYRPNGKTSVFNFPVCPHYLERENIELYVSYKFKGSNPIRLHESMYCSYNERGGITVYLHDAPSKKIESVIIGFTQADAS